MTLEFRTKIEEKPTYFVEKIYKSLKDNEITKELVDATFKHNFDWNVFGSVKPKIHTIRSDPNYRWHKGNKIHFVINNRTPKRFQFAPIIQCVFTQDIWILPSNKRVLIWHLDNQKSNNSFLQGYWHSLPKDKIETLAINDGFENVNDFWKYFNKQLSGVIIHWTSFKY